MYITPIHYIIKTTAIWNHRIALSQNIRLVHITQDLTRYTKMEIKQVMYCRKNIGDRMNLYNKVPIAVGGTPSRYDLGDPCYIIWIRLVVMGTLKRYITENIFSLSGSPYTSMQNNQKMVIEDFSWWITLKRMFLYNKRICKNLFPWTPHWYSMARSVHSRDWSVLFQTNQITWVQQIPPCVIGSVFRRSIRSVCSIPVCVCVCRGGGQFQSGGQ